MIFRENRPTIKAGDYELSIQGSKFHYSTPKTYLDNIQEYEKVELLISKDGEWVIPKEDEVIKKFPRYKELKKRYKNRFSVVGAYLSITLVNELIEYLKETK